MSNLGFRDSSVVIIETSRTVIRGGLGLHELLRTFSVVSIQQAIFSPDGSNNGLYRRKSELAWACAHNIRLPKEHMAQD